jgi:hypothetical protein
MEGCTHWARVCSLVFPLTNLHVLRQVPIADLANHMDDDEGEPCDLILGPVVCPTAQAKFFTVLVVVTLTFENRDCPGLLLRLG